LLGKYVYKIHDFEWDWVKYIGPEVFQKSRSLLKILGVCQHHSTSASYSFTRLLQALYNVSSWQRPEI